MNGRFSKISIICRWPAHLPLIYVGDLVGKAHKNSGILDPSSSFSINVFVRVIRHCNLDV